MAIEVGGVPHAITVPGYSSRSQHGTFAQFPQRDEAEMSDINEAGWSNSEPVEDAPQDVHPDVDPPAEVEPGFSNGMAVTEPAGQADESEADAVVEPDAKPAKKTAARKR